VEHLHRLGTFARGHARRIPEAAQAVDVLARKSHVGGELIGQAADLPPAHGIGLAGQRERPWPRRPMRPVARWQLMMALTLSVPCADWFTPCEKQVTVLGVERKRSKKRATSACGKRVTLADVARLGAIARACASAFSKPRVCASM